MSKKEPLKKIREFIQDNFFAIIIYLVLILITVLIGSLFTPISVDKVPESEIELDRYSAAVNQRTILIRSISYIVSGISVIIAFVSLLQSKNDQKTRERMQVMPFPAYATSLDEAHDSITRTAHLKIKKECPYADSVVQTKFDILIKNIGLGSLVDYEVIEAYYELANGERQDVEIYFTSNFILGKQETTQMAVDITIGFTSEEDVKRSSLEALSIRVVFEDLLGHNYTQEFTVKSEISSVGPQEVTLPDEATKIRKLYSLHPKQIVHTHPFES